MLERRKTLERTLEFPAAVSLHGKRREGIISAEEEGAVRIFPDSSQETLCPGLQLATKGKRAFFALKRPFRQMLFRAGAETRQEPAEPDRLRPVQDAKRRPAPTAEWFLTRARVRLDREGASVL